MGADARQSRFGLPLLVGLVAVAAAFAGSASIRDRDAATSIANSAPAIADVAPSAAKPGAGAVRRKGRCAGCGVVESMRRVDRRELASGACFMADADRFPYQGSSGDGGLATLADTVDGVLAGRPGALKTKVTSSYQIVVRFRDGSRRVFDEATARALQSGERIEVIAGAELPTV